MMTMVDIPESNTLYLEFLRKQKQSSDLPDEMLMTMIEKAAQIGSNAALQYIGIDIVEQARIDGIHLQMHEGGIFGNRLLRAQYDHSVRTITVYQDGINSVLRTPGAMLLMIQPTVEKVREVFLWHEYFHVLEFTKFNLVGEQFKLSKKILGFQRQKPFYPISEISANEFTKKVLNLPHSPIIFDYLISHEDLWKNSN